MGWDNEEYIEFTKNCGECGRRFKMKFQIPEVKLDGKTAEPVITKEVSRFVGFFFPKNEACCQRCSDKITQEVYNEK